MHRRQRYLRLHRICLNASRKVKEEVSRESEVEKARMMLEDEEDEEDEEDVFEDPEEVKKVPKENDTEDEEDDDIEIFNTEEL